MDTSEIHDEIRTLVSVVTCLEITADELYENGRKPMAATITESIKFLQKYKDRLEDDLENIRYNRECDEMGRHPIYGG